MSALITTSDAWSNGWTPDPVLTVSEWADAHRMLPAKAAAEPGQWRTSRTPYLREPMDALSTYHPIERVVIMAGAQVGKTESGLNWLGYLIHHAPGPILMVQPTVETAKRVSKQRIQPMIDVTPALSERIADSRSRDAGNTMFIKEFRGGVLILTGANSAAGLRSMPVRYVFMDEVDAYPPDVDGEGDPVSLAEKRTSTFARKKILLVSTPTIKDLSRIEAEYLKSDQRRYFVPCPECGEKDYLRWDRMKWEGDAPGTAAMVCESCGVLIEEKHKTWLLENGEWRATSTGDGRTAGYHIPSFLSPLGWKSWGAIVAEYLDSAHDSHRLKTWWNTVLGETWEDQDGMTDPNHLLQRRESWPAEVPDGVLTLTAGVDVQSDRLEVKVMGFGHKEEMWPIQLTKIWGDPASPVVWHELFEIFLKQTFRNQSGATFRVRATCVDSSYLTDTVYRMVAPRFGMGVIAIKGASASRRELVSKAPSVNNRYRCRVFSLGVDSGKSIIAARIKNTTPGPGCFHIPPWADLEYCEQLTAERQVKRYDKRSGLVLEWIQVRPRNEAFDLSVYSLAAFYLINGPKVIEAMESRGQEQETTPLAEKQPAGQRPARKRGSGWVQGFR